MSIEWMELASEDYQAIREFLNRPKDDAKRHKLVAALLGLYVNMNPDYLPQINGLIGELSSLALIRKDVKIAASRLAVEDIMFSYIDKSKPDDNGKLARMIRPIMTLFPNPRCRVTSEMTRKFWESFISLIRDIGEENMDWEWCESMGYDIYIKDVFKLLKEGNENAGI